MRLRAAAARRRLTLPELTEYLLAEEMAKHKLPEQLATLDALPLSPVGKVAKKQLAEMLADGLVVAERREP